MFPTHIILPYDGSPAAENAARYVARHVKGTDVSVHLVNLQGPVLPDPALAHAARAIVAWHRDEGQRRLRSGRDILAAEGIPHTHEVAFGEESETIARIARERGAGLVVMGTRARHPLVSLVLGSVSSRVTRASPVPVLLVRDEHRHSARSADQPAATAA